MMEFEMFDLVIITIIATAAIVAFGWLCVVLARVEHNHRWGGFPSSYRRRAR